MNVDDLAERAAIHAALADATRLRIVDALRGSDLSPSELGGLVGVSSNLLAHHIDVLVDVGLVERTASDGDRRRRYLRLQIGALDLIGQPARIDAGSVLFVCTANSARSQLAAAMWNRARADVPGTSAGTEPAGAVHPRAVRAAARRGLDLRSARPRQLDEGALADLCVTVCDRAHEQLRGRALHGPRVVHWSVADPAVAGTARAFDLVADELEARVDALAELVIGSS